MKRWMLDTAVVVLILGGMLTALVASSSASAEPEPEPVTLPIPGPQSMLILDEVGGGASWLVYPEGAVEFKVFGHAMNPTNGRVQRFILEVPEPLERVENDYYLSRFLTNEISLLLRKGW